MGGYLTFPAILAARLRGRPAAVHESNAVLGLANRACVALGAELLRGLPAAPGEPQGTLTGTPLRAALWNPGDARAARDPRFLRPEHITDAVLAKTRQLDALAQARGQSLAQMALAWVLRKPQVTSALIGASSVKQLEGNLAALNNLQFAEEELQAIEIVLKE